MTQKVAVVLGSDSDLPAMEPCFQALRKFQIPFEAHILSAHRTPGETHDFAANAKANGFGVMIAAAGKAAHLAGVLAAVTTLPVIGVPMKTSMMGGLDSLLSMVQMPKGIPVACVAVDGGENAAILAAQMLALADEGLSERLACFKDDLAAQVLEKDKKLQEGLAQ